MDCFSRRAAGCLPLLLMCVLPGCGTPIRKAIFLAPGFQPSAVDEITIPPALDLRLDKTTRVSIDKNARKYVARFLGWRGYQATLADGFGEMDAESIKEDDLKHANAAWIKGLSLPGARWVMVLSVLDVKTRLTFGSTGNAEVAGVLYDTDTGTVAWRGKGICQVGSGGLFGMAMVGTRAGHALTCAVRRLIESVPPREAQE